MSRLTLMLLVDALRADYVRHMPYLAACADRGATGTLRECFGFVPRAAYFGGLDAATYGFTNMYCCEPAASPFSVARVLPSSNRGPGVERHFGVRGFVERCARQRVTPFASTYVSTLEMPMEALAWFAPVETRAPWDRDPGYRSLFAMLDEASVPWYQCSWPETNRLADRSDRGIVAQTLNDLGPHHRFAFVHLQELDGIGHVHGPGSAVLRRTVAATDGLLRQLIETLKGRYDAVDLMLFGDHGMVQVIRTLDVRPALQATGLRFGTDYVYFLDSTMVRFWFLRDGARSRVVDALAPLDGGRMLETADLDRYGIRDCDRRNAEAIFLVEPGVLIFPNFFQSGGEPIRGMHGYDPDCPDNLGFFMLEVADDPALTGRSLGKVDPPSIFPTLLELLDVGPAPKTCAPVIRPVAGTEAPRRFTRHPDERADRFVAGQLDTVCSAIVEAIGEPRAIVLTGSFGRGEGGVVRREDGGLAAVNDYDLIVIDRENRTVQLEALAQKLRPEIGTDYLDLAWSDGDWASLPPTVFNVDLKYGSTTLRGDERVLAQVPDFAAAQIPVFEGVQLLLNRTAGLLLGLRGRFFDGVEPTRDERRHLGNQIAKAWTAMGDAWLIRWSAYDSSYARRRERFAQFAGGAGIPAWIAERVSGAYAAKLVPDAEPPQDPLDEIAKLIQPLHEAIVETIGELTEETVGDCSAAMAAYLETMSQDAAWVRGDNRRCVEIDVLGRSLAEEVDPLSAHESIRHAIYAALPSLLAVPFDASQRYDHLEQARGRLATWFRLPPPAETTMAVWEQTRAAAVKWWWAAIH